jgi:neutral/alkaline ceramidase-like enzyme
MHMQLRGMAIPACLVIGCLPALPAAFRAAAVKVDITPRAPQWLVGYDPRQSTGVHDKIYHRILAVDDGYTKFYLIASDLCLFSPTLYDGLAEQLHKQLGIARQNVWWTVTHTHSAPEVGPPAMYGSLLLGRSSHEWNREYAAQVTDALIAGVKDATDKLEPARLAIGTGISMANLNRRAKDVDGSVTLGLNPDGPVDRQIGVLSFVRPDNSPVATVANYSMHGTVLSGENLEISGDAPGMVEAYVEEKTGVPMLYVNGAAGNIAPIYSVYPDPKSGHLSQFRVLLGDRILAALKSSPGTPTDHVRLAASEITVETPMKHDLKWPPELASYRRETNAGQSVIRLPVRFLKLNDTLIWSAPVELFCEISIAVRNQSPFTHTFYFGYANGWFGYLPTENGFKEGGYEPKTSPFTERAEHDVLTSVLTYIQGLTR